MTIIYESPAEAWEVWRGELELAESHAYATEDPVVADATVTWHPEGTYTSEGFAKMIARRLEKEGNRARVVHKPAPTKEEATP